MRGIFFSPCLHAENSKKNLGVLFLSLKALVPQRLCGFTPTNPISNFYKNPILLEKRMSENREKYDINSDAANCLRAFWGQSR